MPKRLGEGLMLSGFLLLVITIFLLLQNLPCRNCFLIAHLRDEIAENSIDWLRFS